MKRTMKLYGNKVYGVEVSKYVLENGYLDYLTLSKIVGPLSDWSAKTSRITDIKLI